MTHHVVKFVDFRLDTSAIWVTDVNATAIAHWMQQLGQRISVISIRISVANAGMLVHSGTDPVGIIQAPHPAGHLTRLQPTVR
jgi:type II secretory pathway component PulM